MKRLIALTAVIVSMLMAQSCQKEGAWDFNYPKETLCSGTWQGKEVYTGGRWVDITSPSFSKLQFSIKFNTDGTYYGKGYFGNGSGTYTAHANTIVTYVDGSEYYSYLVKSMTGSEAELTMSSRGGSSMDIRVTRN